MVKSLKSPRGCPARWADCSKSPGCPPKRRCLWPGCHPSSKATGTGLCKDLFREAVPPSRPGDHCNPVPNHSPPFSPWAGDGKEKGYRKRRRALAIPAACPASLTALPGAVPLNITSQPQPSFLLSQRPAEPGGRRGCWTQAFPGERWGHGGTPRSAPALQEPEGLHRRVQMSPLMWAAGTDHGWPPQESGKPGFGARSSVGGPCRHRALLGGV